MIAELTMQLRQMSIGGAELEARMAFINEQLELAKSGLDKADEFELVVHRLLPEARERYDGALRERNEIQRAAEGVREPRVEVMD